MGCRKSGNVFFLVFTVPYDEPDELIIENVRALALLLCNYSCDPSTFQKRAKSQNLLDKVFDHLELIEKDYFGLQFLDLSPDPESMVRDKMVSSPSKTKVTLFFWSE